MSSTPKATRAQPQVDSPGTPTPRGVKRQRETVVEDEPPSPTRSTRDGTAAAKRRRDTVAQGQSSSTPEIPDERVPVSLAGLVSRPKLSIKNSMRTKEGLLRAGVAPLFEGPPFTVLSVLNTEPPAPPRLYYDDGKKSTRRPSEFDVWLTGESSKLQEIVPAHGTIIDGISQHAEELLATLPAINPRDHVHQRWLTLVHPALTCRSLPPEVRSEHDTEDWLFSVLIRPAIEVIKAIQAKDAHYDHAYYEYPNVVSGEAAGVKSIPDGVFIAGDQKTVTATLEAKTHKILAAPSPTGTSTFYNICVNNVPRRVVYFHWPAETSDCSGLSIESQILIQVWQQMQEKQVDLGILSSMQSTFFLVKQNQRLHFSRAYRIQHKPLFAVFAFLAVAFGLIPKQVLWDSLPDVVCWNRTFTPTSARRMGIDERTVPSLFAVDLRDV
ncbi:hypothetical protein BKA93DRAFT_822939 [Sparassis latifolia]